MLHIFYFFIILIRSILALNAPDAIQTRSSSEYERYSFSVSPSKSEPVNTDCQYNNTNPSTFDVDYSNCIDTRSVNPGTTQYQDLDTFSDDFTKAMLSIPVMQRFLKRQIPVSETKDSIYKPDYKFFKDMGQSSPEYPALAIAKKLGLFDDSPLPMYFKVVGITIGKFLKINKIAIGSNAVGCYAYFLKRAVLPDSVDSDQALYQALMDTIVNFVNSLGFNFFEKSDILIEFTMSELLALSKK